MSTKKSRSRTTRQANVRFNPERRIPRAGIKGAITNTTTLKGNEALFGVNITATAGRGCFILPLLGGNAAQRVNSPIARVSSLYSNYKYLPGTTFHYSPSTGTTTPGVVHCCYIDNPELFKLAYEAEAQTNAPVGSTNAFLDFVRSQHNSKTFAVWESFAMPINPVTRRKMFNVNETILLDRFGNVEEFERSIQGMFLVAVEGGPADSIGVSMGRPWMNTAITLEGLRGTLDT